MIVALVVATLFIAYANGANDNFKGVATLFGSDAASYRASIAWATLTTFLGSAASALLLNGALVRAFSGKGLVSDALTTDPRFLLAVGGATALTVLLASWIGMPISTTHAIAGALIGTGIAAESEVSLSALGKTFLYPLLLSPLASILLTLILYPVFRSARRLLHVEKETCLCVGESVEAVDLRPDGTAILRATGVALAVDDLSACRSRYAGSLVGFSAQQVLTQLHFLSAGAVSFARGLNDTPKIVALLIAAGLLKTAGACYLAVAALIALGGLLSARRVAETLSHRITAMNDGQAFSANLATALLVTLASGLGLPVSTTHVSVGAIFGISVVNRQARWGSILQIVGAWVITLPLAGILGAALYFAALRFR